MVQLLHRKDRKLFDTNKILKNKVLFFFIIQKNLKFVIIPLIYKINK